MAAGASPPEILPAETPLAEMIPSDAFPVSVASPVRESPDSLARTDPALRQDPTPIPLDRYGAGTPSSGLAPERRIPGHPGTTWEPGPLPAPEAVHAPPTGERPLVNAPVTGTPQITLPGNGTGGAVPSGTTPPTVVRGAPGPLAPGSPAVGYQPPPGPETASGSGTGNFQNGGANVMDTLVSTHAPGGGSSPATSSSGAEDGPEGTPRHERSPSSPPAPLGGSSFSLSGGQAGPGSGLAPLLVCVLASGLILLRRDGLFFGWAPYEPPKPCSALLLPLERPG